MFIRNFLCAFVALTLFVTSAHAIFGGSTTTEAQTLKMKFVEGQKFTISNEIDFNANADLPSQMLTEMGLMPLAADGSKASDTQSTEAKGVFHFDWDVAVKEVRNDGSALLMIVLSKADIKFDAHMGDDQFNYEADLLNGPSSKDGMPAPQIPQESRTMTLVVAPNGAILSANGEEIAGNIDSFFAQLQKDEVNLTKEQLETISKMFVNFYVRYPERAIKEGDTWNNKVDLSSLVPQGKQGELTVNQFKLLLAQTWKVADQDDSSFNLEESSDAMPKFAIQFESKEASVAIDAEGTEKGSVLVNSLTGMFQTIERSFELEGNFIAQDKTDEAQKWSVPFTFNLNSKLNVK